MLYCTMTVNQTLHNSFSSVRFEFDMMLKVSREIWLLRYVDIASRKLVSILTVKKYFANGTPVQQLFDVLGYYK